MKLKRRILVLTIIFTLLLSSTAYGAITFKNIGNPYGTVNALAYVNNHLICFCENGMILTSDDEGTSFKTNQFGQNDAYRNYAIYKNNVIGYNQIYGKNIAVSSDSINWSAFNMSEKIALITSGADGFVLITNSGKLYTSKTGMEKAWELQYTVTLPNDTRNIYYLDKTDTYLVVAYHSLHTTKDFKNFVPITLDEDVTFTSATVMDQFIYIINENTSSVQVFDYNLNLKDTYPEVFVNDMMIYPVSLYNNAGKVGYITSNKGVFGGDKAENSYLVDQNGTIVVDTGIILGAYLGNNVVINNKVFIGDPENGLVRVDLTTKKTDVLFSSTKFSTTLHYINDKIMINNGNQLFTLNSNLQKEVIVDFNSSKLGAYYIGLYNNGKTYTIEYADGRRFTSSDLKSWTAIQNAPYPFGFKKVINFNNHLLYTAAGTIFVDCNGSGDDFRVAANTKDMFFEKLSLNDKSTLSFLETNFGEGNVTYTDSIIFNNKAYFAARNGKVTVVDKNLNCKRYDFASLNLSDAQMKVINNTLFIVADGVIYTSADGEKWTKLKSNGLGLAKDIAYGKGTYVIVGHSGSIMESTDLVNWKEIDSGYECQFNKVMFDGEKFVIASYEGIILVSTSITAEQTTQQSAIQVTVNGSPVLFPDVTPFLDKNNRTQVPVRFVAEALGGSVKWIGDTQTVVIEKNGDTILFKINENAYTINGKKVSVDSSSTLKDSRTFVPLRFVSEALGATVKWNATTSTVEISK